MSEYRVITGFLCLLKLVKADSLSRCLMKWAEEMLPENRKGVTVSLDGETCPFDGENGQL